MTNDSGIYVSRRQPRSVKQFDLIEEAGTAITYRCMDCKNCVECKSSGRFESISIQEEIEQTVIERTVDVNIETGVTTATLPFMDNPAEKLKANSERIANKIYHSQVRKLEKNPIDRQSVIESESKLQQLGYVDFVENLTDDEQQSILNNEAKYFIPWRAVWNTNSLSSRCRLVFDASQANERGCSLNDILAKGNNSMNKLVEILVRWTTKKVGFHTDIQKMYNTVRLDKSHWCYQMYLWCDKLSREPKWKVVKTLIYGVKSGGNQAVCGLRKTAKLLSNEYPRASEVIHKDIYVDDCISGQDTHENLRTITDDLEIVLNKGDFQLKGITMSGQRPSSNLSGDSDSIGVAGMKWFSKGDFLKLNIKDELNFSRKIRGKKSLVNVGQTPDNLTRRDCVGKVEEIFDPLGKVTPITCGFKLDINELSQRKLDWGDTIPDDLRRVWETNFEMIKEIGKVEFNRAIVPTDAVSLDIETLDTADASMSLVCVAIYARFELPNNKHSCQLIFSRSKIIPQNTTMPRAELLAATLNATTGHVVKLSLGEHHKGCLKLSDSQVVLHWINSTKSELKLLVRNRVIEINRLTNRDNWRYISTKDMIADMGTRKGTKIREVWKDSEWINGKPWMRLDASEFPVKTIFEISWSRDEREGIVREGTPLCNSGPNSLSKVSVYSGAINKSAQDKVKSIYEFYRYIIDPDLFRFSKIRKQHCLRVVMAPVNEANLKIAPAFYYSQVDLFGPFKAYSPVHARGNTKVYFVVFCCTTT